MRIQAYLRVVSDEATIRAIHKDANIPGATIKRLKAPRGTGSDDWWWIVIGAFLPWAVSQVVMWISWRIWGYSAVNLSLIAATLFSFLWLAASIKYYRRVRTWKARWLFALSPIAF